MARPYHVFNWWEFWNLKFCLFAEAKLQEFGDEHPDLLESPWKDAPFFHFQVQVSTKFMIANPI